VEGGCVRARLRVYARWGITAPLSALLLLSACLDTQADDAVAADAIPVALLLSYTGTSAANSINSERAVLMAVEEVNRAGGVSGRPIRLVMNDIQSDASRAMNISADLLAREKIAAFIGPDSPNVVNQLFFSLRQQTLFLPSVASPARDHIFGAHNWFTFAPNVWTLACAFQRRLDADGIRNPLILFNPDSFHAELAVALTSTLSAPNRAVAIPARATLSSSEVEEVQRREKDALLLIAFPESAASVVSELSFRTRTRTGPPWYLSPTLHTPRFFDNVPPGALEGAQGVGPGRQSGEAFERLFASRWNDAPLDEAFAFYDAAAVVSLALQEAFVKSGTLPSAETLGGYVRPVAGPPGLPIAWNELGRGLELIRSGQDVDYQGVSGQLDFNELGDPAVTLLQWWRLEPQGPVSVGAPMASAVTNGSQCNR